MVSERPVPQAPRMVFRRMGEDDLDLIHSLLGECGLVIQDVDVFGGPKRIYRLDLSLPTAD